jgi:hypothetical protein
MGKLPNNLCQILRIVGRTPVRHEVAPSRAVTHVQEALTSPSIRLDEPRTLNKERARQCSEARKRGNRNVSGRSSW